MSRPEIHTVGKEKVAVTITRKTDGDLLVSQYSIERWFSTPEAAANALREVMGVFIEFPLDDEHPKGGVSDGDGKIETG